MLEKSIAFLTILKENNYKEWFHENKPLYDEARKEFEVFTGKLIEGTNLIDKEIGFPAPKDCIFRIFRDVRFSPDKTPYKTNFGTFLAKGGNRKSEYGGYYVHLEPGNCMVGGGIWMPQPDILKAVREEIYHNIDEFLAILANPEFKKHFGELDTDYSLKTAPKDYPKDWPYIHLLKLKCFTVSQMVPNDFVTSSDFLAEVLAAFKTMQPLNQFFNRVIEDIR
ncbi:MAG: DUF2461 domain-containing protein [Bacteroidota bacterium]|nr:DUF2461 domain-containing protein [Bacteroidota bacterium]